MTKYVLPALPYDYDALEPHISGRIMQLHHDKHHRAYVDGANQACEMLEQARDKGDLSKIAATEETLAFNLSGQIGRASCRERVEISVVAGGSSKERGKW